ncbi:hypothetical protein QR680_018696 [Steinernema hermaphroditum]|uniref:ribonuclease H n=1 Tax=Steinernema hermaphroditum TaxID=289476 RepID=A0AA39LR50_9BILA|nr:hypothetical protein QR680_018696 [Steinernema hermaphroditum]
MDRRQLSPERPDLPIPELIYAWNRSFGAQSSIPIEIPKPNQDAATWTIQRPFSLFFFSSVYIRVHMATPRMEDNTTVARWDGPYLTILVRLSRINQTFCGTTNALAVDASANGTSYGPPQGVLSSSGDQGGAPRRQERSRSRDAKRQDRLRSRSVSRNRSRSKNRQRNRSSSCGPIPKLTSHEEEQLRRVRHNLQDKGPAPGTPNLVVYTDGSVVQNNSTGIAGYFGPGHELNFAQRLSDVTEHNSGYAEIRAACEALRRIAAWNGYQGQKVVIRTDYLSTVDAMQKESNPYHRFGAEYAQLYKTARLFPNGVEFEHVYGHNGEPGNEEVDRMANSAAWGGEQQRSRSVDASRSRARSRSRSRPRALSADPTRRSFVNPRACSPKLSPELENRVNALRETFYPVDSTYGAPVKTEETQDGENISSDSSSTQTVRNGTTLTD